MARPSRGRAALCGPADRPGDLLRASRSKTRPFVPSCTCAEPPRMGAEPRRHVRCEEGLASAAARRGDRCALHRGASHAGNEPPRRRSRTRVQAHDRARRSCRTTRRSRSAKVRRDQTQSALGCRSDVHGDMDRFRLCRLRHRRLLAAHCRLARLTLASQRLGTRRARASASPKTTWDRPRAPQRQRRSNLSIRYTDRLAEAGVHASVGSVGDSYDNALAETINGVYKAEVIHRKGPWRSVEAVELATLAWVDWFNNRRLLGSIGYVPPTEFESMYYAAQRNPLRVANSSN